MFERAAAAWEIQSEEERAARAAWERIRREEFEAMLKEITGVHTIRAQASSTKLTDFEMTAEVEGVLFVSEMSPTLRPHIWGVRIVTKSAGSAEKRSELIRTTGDLGRELERMKIETAETSESTTAKPESADYESIEHLLSIFS